MIKLLHLLAEDTTGIVADEGLVVGLRDSL